MSGVLLLCGRRGVGKSTAAAVLVERLGAVEIAQADPLKALCGRVFMWSDEILRGPSSARDVADQHYADRAAWRGAFERLELEGPRWLLSLGLKPSGRMHALRGWLALLGVESVGRGVTPRRALQTLGTEWGRAKVYPDVWIKAALLRATFLIQDGAPLVVISDGRFENEVACATTAGARTFLITSPTSPNEGDAHASEHGLDNVPADAFDAMLHNPKQDRDQFRDTVEQAVRALFKVAA